MNNYVLEVWYRHGKFDKDFEVVEIEADSDEEAFLLVKDLKNWVFRIDVISKNGVKSEQNG